MIISLVDLTLVALSLLKTKYYVCVLQYTTFGLGYCMCSFISILKSSDNKCIRLLAFGFQFPIFVIAKSYLAVHIVVVSRILCCGYLISQHDGLSYYRLSVPPRHMCLFR
ncbi:unnamed protein product [Cuscuta epithymum]|uniref:Uncharacterized protein n=1 Tax=Cuscuta epithymum TaxID=186058 RepID=A0AAV0CPL2_9ASTE|nr:unnamed protein product [Cuscuta epithymum]